MLEVRTHHQVPGGALAAAWEDLVAACPDATPFQAPAFLGVWVRELGGGVSPRVWTFHEGDRLAGVAAGQLGEEGGAAVLRFLGGTEVTDYQGPVARPDDQDAVARAFIEELADDGGWERAVLEGLAEDTEWHVLLARHAKEAGLDVLEDDVHDVCPQIDLSEGYEGYLAGLTSKQRGELKRKARKLAREVGEVSLREAGPGHVTEGLEELFSLAARGEDGKARFFLDDRMRAFFRGLAGALGPEGRLRVHALDVGGLPAAVCVSLVGHGRWGVYNMAFDPALSEMSPGMVLLTQLLRVAAEEVGTVDLLRGGESYKYRFGASDRALRRLTLARG